MGPVPWSLSSFLGPEVSFRKSCLVELGAKLARRIFVSFEEGHLACWWVMAAAILTIAYRARTKSVALAPLENRP